MKRKIYNKIVLTLLLLIDFGSNLVAYIIVFDSIKLSSFDNTISGISTSFILLSQLIWSTTFFFFNLYDTRSTLSRFDEIIRIFPVIYGITVVGITFDVFGLINLNIDYKSLLSYALLFSFILIVGRFLIHTLQKNMLKRKIGLNNAVILGLNRRGLATFESLQNQNFHFYLILL